MILLMFLCVCVNKQPENVVFALEAVKCWEVLDAQAF
jgi:hypothetical protein